MSDIGGVWQIAETDELYAITEKYYAHRGKSIYVRKGSLEVLPTIFAEPKLKI